MKNEIESGLHPDADQISAFVEHALPAHERQQMLAHLAVCPECRSTLAMSLPNETGSLAPAEPIRRVSWFAGWRLAVPVAALAAITLYIVFIQKASHSRRPVDQPSQLATSQGPASSVADQLSTSPEASPEDKTVERRKSSVSSKQKAESSAASNQLPVPRDALQAPSKDSRDEGVASTNRLAAESSAPPANSRLSTAGSAPPIETTGNSVGGPTLGESADIPAQFFLPSGLPVLSVATHLQQILAIDSRNNLFLSDDGGTSWKAVPVRWKGRAVKANLVSYGSSLQPAAITTQVLQSAGFVSSGPEGAPKPSANNPVQGPTVSLTGTVTDQSGAVIPNATVKVTESSGRVGRTTTSDANGHFVVDGLTPGFYDIKTEARGFQQQLTQGVKMSATQPNVENVALSVGAAAQTVTVEAASTDLDVVRSPEPVADKSSFARPTALPLFEITTDIGEHWTSTDGMTWKRK
jgi:Carboxypeptidase regulatory-like domain/Putative zinc-finger